MLSNYVPLLILTTTVFSILSATGQSGAETVYTGAAIYLLVAGWLNYLIFGASFNSVKYVQPTWSDRRGPNLYPSILYVMGIVDDDGSPLKEEKTEED